MGKEKEVSEEVTCRFKSITSVSIAFYKGIYSSLFVAQLLAYACNAQCGLRSAYG